MLIRSGKHFVSLNHPPITLADNWLMFQKVKFLHKIYSWGELMCEKNECESEQAVQERSRKKNAASKKRRKDTQMV